MVGIRARRRTGRPPASENAMSFRSSTRRHLGQPAQLLELLACRRRCQVLPRPTAGLEVEAIGSCACREVKASGFNDDAGTRLRLSTFDSSTGPNAVTVARHRDARPAAEAVELGRERLRCQL